MILGVGFLIVLRRINFKLKLVFSSSSRTFSIVESDFYVSVDLGTDKFFFIDIFEVFYVCLIRWEREREWEREWEKEREWKKKREWEGENWREGELINVG